MPDNVFPGHRLQRASRHGCAQLLHGDTICHENQGLGVATATEQENHETVSSVSRTIFN